MNVETETEYLIACELNEQEAPNPLRRIRRVCLDTAEIRCRPIRHILKTPYKTLRVYVGRRITPCKLRIYGDGTTRPWQNYRYGRGLPGGPHPREYAFRKWLYPLLPMLLAMAEPGIQPPRRKKHGCENK